MSAKIWVIFSIFLFCFLPCTVSGAEITLPEVRLTNDEIKVTTAVMFDENGLADLKNGIAKELTFYLDIYRVWNVWPDEFIAGKKILKTLTVDPIKREYIATSFDGTTLIKKRFRNFDSMLNWALMIKDQQLAYIRELQPANYFVRITVESRLRSLPPVIGYLLFFVPEKEFKVTRDSAIFMIGNGR